MVIFFTDKEYTTLRLGDSFFMQLIENELRIFVADFPIARKIFV